MAHKLFSIEQYSSMQPKPRLFTHGVPARLLSLDVKGSMPVVVAALLIGRDGFQDTSETLLRFTTDGSSLSIKVSDPTFHDLFMEVE